jgi:hypothetical protein
VLAVAGAEIDRGRGLTALPAPQLGQYLDERAIAVVANEQAQRDRPIARGSSAARRDNQAGLRGAVGGGRAAGASASWSSG